MKAKYADYKCEEGCKFQKTMHLPGSGNVSDF